MEAIKIDFAVMKIHPQQRCQRKRKHHDHQINCQYKPSGKKAIGISSDENGLGHDGFTR